MQKYTKSRSPLKARVAHLPALSNPLIEEDKLIPEIIKCLGVYHKNRNRNCFKKVLETIPNIYNIGVDFLDSPISNYYDETKKECVIKTSDTEKEVFNFKVLTVNNLLRKRSSRINNEITCLLSEVNSIRSGKSITVRDVMNLAFVNHLSKTYSFYNKARKISLGLLCLSICFCLKKNPFIDNDNYHAFQAHSVEPESSIQKIINSLIIVCITYFYTNILEMLKKTFYKHLTKHIHNFIQRKKDLLFEQAPPPLMPTAGVKWSSQNELAGLFPKSPVSSSSSVSIW